MERGGVGLEGTMKNHSRLTIQTLYNPVSSQELLKSSIGMPLSKDMRLITLLNHLVIPFFMVAER